MGFYTLELGLSQAGTADRTIANVELCRLHRLIRCLTLTMLWNAPALSALVEKSLQESSHQEVVR